MRSMSDIVRYNYSSVVTPVISMHIKFKCANVKVRLRLTTTKTTKQQSARKLYTRQLRTQKSMHRTEAMHRFFAVLTVNTVVSISCRNEQTVVCPVSAGHFYFGRFVAWSSSVVYHLQMYVSYMHELKRQQLHEKLNGFIGIKNV